MSNAEEKAAAKKETAAKVEQERANIKAQKAAAKVEKEKDEAVKKALSEAAKENELVIAKAVEEAVKKALAEQKADVVFSDELSLEEKEQKAEIEREEKLKAQAAAAKNGDLRRFKLKDIPLGMRSSVSPEGKVYRVAGLKFFQKNIENQKTDPKKQNILPVPDDIAMRLSEYNDFVEVK